MFGLNSTLESLLALQRSMDEALKSDYFGKSTYSGGSPLINVFKEGEDTLVTVELPGVKKEDIHVEVKRNILRIKGKRDIAIAEGASAHRRERSGYDFDRTFKLNNMVDEGKIKAEFSDGILAVLLPAREEEKPKQIAII